MLLIVLYQIIELFQFLWLCEETNRHTDRQTYPKYTLVKARHKVGLWTTPFFFPSIITENSKKLKKLRMMFDEVFFFTCDMIDFSRMEKKNWIEIELSWKENNNRRHINLFSGSMLDSAFDFGYVSSEIHSNWNNSIIWYNTMRSTILYDIIYWSWYDMLHDKYWKLKCPN